VVETKNEDRSENPLKKESVTRGGVTKKKDENQSKIHPDSYSKGAWTVKMGT